MGRNPVRRVEKWASESIEVTGRVPSVVEHLRESAVVIVPLRIGGGTRLKIYEAMAAAKAVVSTTVGAEGLDVHNGRDIILADDARAFSQAVIMLLRDRELRRRYEKAAAETAARYDWPAIGERFGEVLQSVAEKKSEARICQAELERSRRGFGAFGLKKIGIKKRRGICGHRRQHDGNATTDQVGRAAESSQPPIRPKPRSSG